MASKMGNTRKMAGVPAMVGKKVTPRFSGSVACSSPSKGKGNQSAADNDGSMNCGMKGAAC